MDIEEALKKMAVRKKTISLVFIGHVDAGKSTTGGHILYLAGKIDKRTLDKYERESKEKNKESWYLSWALDSNPEERERGKTIEVAHASFETERYQVQMLDAPGHRMYVPGMIQGASQADVAVLLVSARQNEFEAGFEKSGQTREHIYLAKACGIQKICVLVNKMDDATVSWSEERYKYILNSTKKMLVSLFGKENVAYVPISGFHGDNIKERVSTEKCEWYKSCSFFEYIDNIEIKRNISSPMLATITESMKETAGTVILARIELGILDKGQVLIYPGAKKASVCSITKEEEDIDKASAGDTVRVKFKETEEISIGDFIAAPEYVGIQDSNYFMAQISVLGPKALITKGYSAMMHMGPRVTVISFGELYKKENEKIQRIKYAKAGERFICEILCSQVLPLEVFAPERRTGMFIIRSESVTIGFGKVLKIKRRRE